MRSSMLTPLLAGLGYALPQDAGCETTTEEVIVPTSTATYYSTYVTTIEATTAEDLGTYTEIVGVSSTKTIATVTAPADDCTTSAAPTSYTNASGPVAYTKRALGLNPRACTVTETSTTTYGQTYTFVQATGVTSTFTDYTAFTQATVTSTSYGGTAYAVATASASDTCEASSGATLDSRCAPSALISAAGGKNESTYGLDYASYTPAGGATYSTTTSDGSQCCQLCVEADSCSASAWDSRTGDCKLAFAVDPTTGDLSCGEGLLAYYGAGPAHPMSPGSGLFVASVCGNVEFGSAMPDDGS